MGGAQLNTEYGVPRVNLKYFWQITVQDAYRLQRGKSCLGNGGDGLVVILLRT